MPKNVWIDDAYDYSGQTLAYRIKMNGETISEETASAIDFPIRIYLNRVAQAYLHSDFPESTGVTEDGRSYSEFSIVEISGDTEVQTLYSETYVNAYGGEFKPVMETPVNGHADARQRLFFTSYNNSATTIEI